MRIAIFAMFLVCLAVVNVAFATPDVNENQFEKFCALDPGRRSQLVGCIAGANQQAQQFLDHKGKDARTLSEDICQTPKKQFPEEILSHLDGLQDIIKRCVQQIQ
uniref:Putative secreted protein n=1 Tax=Amblyomma aureolatum TaxID=187763 RepID=A0A1E1X093_9ACAR